MTEIKGTVKVIGETQVISDKFKKRDIVVTIENGEYPQHITLQFTQDKCNLVDKLVKGADATFHINLRGKEYQTKQGETKYFNSIECWKIDNISVGQFQQADSKTAVSGQEDNTLPF
jgi:hypothetical protein